jgi:UDP-N-acetylglucosamine 2-epimerase (non-hydrolysing)
VASVCFVVGARPNFMKVAPVLHALRNERPDLDVLLVHTGQHYDHEMSDVFLAELELPTPDVRLEVGGGTHAEQTAEALVGIERVLLEHRPQVVVVAGDVNSTLAGALAAVKLRLPVTHIEAGLRSSDFGMPEEHNRRLTDHASTLLLAHSDEAVENLRTESIVAGVELVGNTMVDSLLRHLEAARARKPWEEFGVEAGGYGLVTLHRPSLVDDDRRLRDVVERLVELARNVPLVFPVHPRTRARLDRLGLVSSLESGGVAVTAPLGYFTFVGLEAAAMFVLSDSGGIQEETSALGVRCFTLRRATERPVTVRLGTNTVIGDDPAAIAAIPRLLEEPKRAEPIPFWDGRAGIRSAAAIAGLVDRVEQAPAAAVAEALRPAARG